MDTNSNLNEDETWSKDLTHMPPFTIKEIEKHRVNSGKNTGISVIKTLDRGKKFKEERYISSDSIYTSFDENSFFVKGVCRASMKER